MVKKTSLGRGFDALIPKELDSTLLQEDKHRVQKIFINDITPNPDQPRREIDSTALAEMTQSVKQHGVLQPIMVVRDKNGFRIVAGERRWRAAKAAGLDHIPAIVRSLQELEQIELALIENIQRVDLSPLEQALSVYKLQQQFNMSLEEVSKKLGKATSTVSNMTRLLQLPEAAREALRSQKISEGHARTILSLKGRPELQSQLLSYILNNNWSVRQAEQFVAGARTGAKASKEEAYYPQEQYVAKQFKQLLNIPVKIRHLGKGGQIIIAYKSPEELQKITKNLEERAEQ